MRFTHVIGKHLKLGCLILEAFFVMLTMKPQSINTGLKSLVSMAATGLTSSNQMRPGGRIWMLWLNAFKSNLLQTDFSKLPKRLGLLMSLGGGRLRL